MLILIYICSNHRGWLDKTSSSKQFLVIWEGNSWVNLARELLLLTQYFHQPYRIIIHRLPPPPPLTSIIVCTEGYWSNQLEHVAWTDWVLLLHSGWYATPLQGYSQEFNQAFLTIRLYPFVLLGRERYCECNTVTQARSQTQTSWPRVLHIDHKATASLFS